MDASRILMYVSLMQGSAAQPVYREMRFRLPSAPEQAMGLWVDRIGAAPREGGRWEKRRLLGQYAAVGVEAGRGVFESPSSGRRSVEADDVILIFPDEPHRYYGTPQWSTRWVVWNGPEAARIASLGGLAPANPVVRHAATAVAQAYAGLQPLMREEGFGAVLQRKQQLLALLSGLVRHVASATTAGADAWTALIRDLETAPRPLLSVPGMAARCHVSVAQFRRQFRHRTGRSPLAFVTALRMARAKDLLAEGVAIKDVAARLGYGDVFHFMRVFRRATGQTAGRFRAANRMPAADGAGETRRGVTAP